MKNDEMARLLGGYATNTLTDAERQALFTAALAQAFGEGVAMIGRPGHGTRDGVGDDRGGGAASISEKFHGSEPLSWSGLRRPCAEEN